MSRSLFSILRLGLHLVLAAGLLWLVWEGPLLQRSQQPLPVEEAELGALRPAQQPGAVERHTHFGLERREDLDALALVPDPRAVRHQLRPSVPLRVFDPASLHLQAGRRARAARPWLVDVELVAALASDELWLELPGKAPLRVELNLGQGHATGQLRFSPLAPGLLEFSLRWTGRRQGRAGDLRLSYRVPVGPPPQLRLGPGVAASGAFTRALRTQGFELAEAEGSADLMLALMGQAPGPGLVDAVDAGLGLLLVASEGQPVDLGYLPLLPVVPLPLEEPEEMAAKEGEGGRASSSSSGEAPGPGSAGAGEGDPEAMAPGLRRSGGVSEAERSKAARDRAEREVRAAAVVFLIDASGSMQVGRPSRIAMAKQAVLASALQLGEGDEFAVLSFGEFAKLLMPMGRADRRKLLREKLGDLEAKASSTFGYPALRAAHEQLKQVLGRNPLRHVVMVTDGELQDQLRAPYRRLLAQMRREGISVSAIGIWSENQVGGDPFAFLERDVVRASGGRFAVARDPRELPRLLLGELRLVRGAQRLQEGQAKAAGAKAPEERAAGEAKPEAKEEAPEPAAASKDSEAPKLDLFLVESEPVLGGLEAHEWPPLAGALPLEAQLRTRVHLALGEEGRIALATAPFGLGRVAVFAGSDGGRWAADFVEDKSFPQLLGQLGSWLQREDGNASLTLEPRTRTWLAGSGREPGLLELAASRMAARCVADFAKDLAVQSREEPRAPWFKIGLLGAGFLLLLGFEWLFRARL
ncbi:MAG: hypothetical protein CSA62_06570 [Planctomycetota bacterium]|nr:MAG: hypothetical protein CSA62_06570 [Planctomycetota bacterium]